MRVHFIAIGGSAMHNLAIALYKKGLSVTGSDDEILEPSRSRLEKHGLLPPSIGWDIRKINDDIDAVILGMHARADNPELIKAQELGLKIFSYPEYIFEQTKDKLRVVVGGSHGKTTITSIILHVLRFHKVKCDYMVGAQLEGFDTMVELSEDARIAVIEGDEYLSSPIDRRPKFHLYHPDIAILSGIAWDHINVFPTFENYVSQFDIFLNLISPNGALVFCEQDKEVKKLAEKHSKRINVIPYTVPKHKIENGITFIFHEDKREATVPLQVFGDHNLMNIEGARKVCNLLNVTDDQFYEAILSFKGASKRLELVVKKEHFTMYKDFAHSPSKLKATTAAVKNQYPERKLVACMELHTFSSLNKNFLGEYNGAMQSADKAFVYFNPHTIEHKKLPNISEKEIETAFGGNNVTVFNNSQNLVKALKEITWKDTNLLMMSSGNFDGLDFNQLGEQLIG